jgi:hypothetical protein
MMSLARVLLPHPLSPTTPSVSPVLSSSDTPRSAWCPPEPKRLR